MDPAWIAFWSGLVGALIGAGASIGTTVLVQRDERKRRAEEREYEDRTRFHLQRIQYYAEFETAVTRLFTHHVKVRLGLPPDPNAFGRFLDGVVEANARVSYVAAPSVTGAAADLQDFLAAEEGKVNDVVYERLLGEFKRAARDELGVNPPIVPTAASR